MVVIVVLPSLLIMPPLTRDEKITCPRCRQQVPFVLHKFVRRKVYHSTGTYVFNIYSLFCTNDGKTFTFPLFGVVDPGALSAKQHFSAALNLRMVIDFAVGADYSGIIDALSESGVSISRSTLWRQLRKAPWEQLRRLHFSNRLERILEISYLLSFEQENINERIFSNPVPIEEDIALFGGVLALVFENAGVAETIGEFLADYINNSMFSLFWAKVKVQENFPDDLDMPADFPHRGKLTEALGIIRDVYRHVVSQAKDEEINA